MKKKVNIYKYLSLCQCSVKTSFCRWSLCTFRNYPKSLFWDVFLVSWSIVCNILKNDFHALKDYSFEELGWWPSSLVNTTQVGRAYACEKFGQKTHLSTFSSLENGSRVQQFISSSQAWHQICLHLLLSEIIRCWKLWLEGLEIWITTWQIKSNTFWFDYITKSIIISCHINYGKSYKMCLPIIP